MHQQRRNILFKVSEGLDFSDNKARAVVVTGIPYAPSRDPKVEPKTDVVVIRGFRVLACSSQFEEGYCKIAYHISPSGFPFSSFCEYMLISILFPCPSR